MHIARLGAARRVRSRQVKVEAIHAHRKRSQFADLWVDRRAMKGLEKALDLARQRKVGVAPVAQEEVEFVVHLLGGADPPDAVACVVRHEQ